MEVYLVKLEIYDYGDEISDTRTICNIYSSFEKAKEEGLKEIQARIKSIEESQKVTFKQLLDEEKLDYSFEITEIANLEYAENFNVEYEWNLKSDNYSKLEPTHKTYYLDYEGNIVEIFYEYRIKNSLEKIEHLISVYPEDLQEGASEKFKIGDIVKLKAGAERDPFDENNKDRIYIVRYLPRKFNKEKYFRNTYALISLYENDLEDKIQNKWGNKELFTHEHYERDIEKYNGVIEKDSEYDLLSRILKRNLATSWEYWDKIKVGMLPLNIDTFRENNAEDTDDWGFYSTALPPNKTGLKVTIFPEKNEFGINIKDYLPKIRIQNKIDDYNDTFFISLEENPRVVIGENKLSKADYEEVCKFVKKNLDILLKHFEHNNEFYDDELWNKLKEKGSIKSRKDRINKYGI